ncbi:MAG TPA: hypothetical protein VFA15_08015, partial [Nitrososphaera sp.]|nr:hypothetical protein [Nitrososphaera sp.]
MPSPSKVPGSKKFVYFALEDDGQSPQQQQQQEKSRDLPKDVLDKLLKTIGREALREKTPSLQELEQSLQNAMSQMSSEQGQQEKEQQQSSQSGNQVDDGDGMPL